MSLASTRAIMSVLDVVEELAQGLAHGQKPDSEWAAQVKETFDAHRADLRGEEDAWKEGGNDIDPRPGPGSEQR